MSPETQWVARIPRRVVIHRMETADSLESRVFWAIVLWSICGPQRSIQVVIKDRKGFIQKDAEGNPTIASQADLRELLGLAPGMRAHVSRAIQRLKQKHSIRTDQKGVIYFEESPPEVPPKDPSLVASTGNWNIAGIVASTGNFPSDPVARTEAIQWIENLSTEWRNHLKTLKTGYRKLLVQGLSERGILIDKRRQMRRGETALDIPSPPASQPVSDVVENSPAQAGRPEEDWTKEPETEPPTQTPHLEEPEPAPSPELREKIRSHLVQTFPIRYPIEAETLDDCARHLADDAGFAEFQHETNNIAIFPPEHKSAPKSWRYFPAVAARIAQTRPQWSAARSKAPPGEEEHWAVKLQKEMTAKGLK